MLKGKKKICLFTINLGRGGAETVLVDLANSFSENHDVSICVLENLLHLSPNKNIPIKLLLNKKYSFPFNLLLIPYFAFKLYRYLKSENIDTVISFLERPNFINAFLSVFNKKYKAVITVNTALSQWYSKNAIQSKVGNLLVRTLYPEASHVICCSEYIKKEMQELYRVPKSKLHTIYNGIDLNKISILKKEPLISQSALYKFICVASFNEGKNHAMLLASFKKFIETDRKAELILIGKGQLSDKIKQQITADDVLNKYVKFIGFANNQYQYMANANCFVMSTNFEGLPTVLMEAMACELQMICTDCISGPRELLMPSSTISTQLVNDIEIGEFGILTPVGNAELLSEAMCNMFDSPEIVDYSLQTIKEHVVKFDIKYMTSMYAEIVYA